MPEQIFDTQIQKADELFEKYFPNDKGSFKQLFKIFQDLYIGYQSQNFRFISTTTTLKDYLSVIKEDFNQHFEKLSGITEDNKEEIKKLLQKEFDITNEELKGAKNV